MKVQFVSVPLIKVQFDFAAYLRTNEVTEDYSLFEQFRNYRAYLFLPIGPILQRPVYKAPSEPGGNRAVGGLGCERGTLRQVVDERNRQKLDL